MYFNIFINENLQLLECMAEHKLPLLYLNCLSLLSIVHPEATTGGKVGAVEGFCCEEDWHPHDTCECVWVEDGGGGRGVVA